MDLIPVPIEEDPYDNANEIYDHNFKSRNTIK